MPPRLTVPQPTAIGLTRFVAFGDSLTWGAQSSFDPRFLYAAANGGYVERLQAGLNAYYTPQRFIVFNEGDPGELAHNAVSSRRFREHADQPQAARRCCCSRASTI